MNFGKVEARVFRVGSCIYDTGKQCIIRNPQSLDAVEEAASGDAGCAGEASDTVQLAPRDFQVLQILLERAPDLVSGSELLAVAWRDKYVCDNVVYQSIGRLRAAFGDSPVKSQYIATVSKRGYRLVAPTTLLQRHKPAPQVNAEIAPVLIAPFARLGGCDLAPEFISTLGFEVGHQLITAGIGVIHPETACASSDRISQARQLGAQTLLEASVLANGAKVRVMATLTEVATRVQIWSGRYDLPLDEIFDIQCLLAEAAVDDICAKLPERLGPRAAPRRVEEPTGTAERNLLVGTGQVIGLN